jgi:hypothetical protein
VTRMSGLSPGEVGAVLDTGMGGMIAGKKVLDKR